VLDSASACFRRSNGTSSIEAIRANQTMRYLHFSTPEKPGPGDGYGCHAHAMSEHGEPQRYLILGVSKAGMASAALHAREHATNQRTPGLACCHGWTQAQIAELLRADVRMVRRWWEPALVRLHRVMRNEEESLS